jgi:hypothetical protein
LKAFRALREDALTVVLKDDLCSALCWCDLGITWSDVSMLVRLVVEVGGEVLRRGWENGEEGEEGEIGRPKRPAELEPSDEMLSSSNSMGKNGFEEEDLTFLIVLLRFPERCCDRRDGFLCAPSTAAHLSGG